MQNLRWICALAVVAGFVPGGPLGAAEIKGAVTDAAGSALPAAGVALENAAAGLETATTTDAGGRYSFPGMTVGIYRVSALHSGFSREARTVSLASPQDSLAALLQHSLVSVSSRQFAALVSPSLAITSFEPTADALNGYYRITYTGTPTGAHLYFDTDRNAGTGYPVAGAGANYMVELGSAYGNLYSYSGTGGGWGWTSLKAVTYTNTGGVANITVARADLGSPGSIDVVGSIQDAATTLFTTKVTQVLLDTAPPSVPTNLTGTAVSSSQVNLSWEASTDNVGVRGYTVYLNDTALDTTTATTFQHTSLTPNTTYNYRVSAYDAVPNHSAWTATPVAVTTQGAALAISSFQATADAANGYYRITYTGTPTYGRVYFDTDRNTATGYPVAGTGANSMVELGLGYGNLYRYSGTGGSWGWTTMKPVVYTSVAGSANITVLRADLGSPQSIDVVGNISNVSVNVYTAKVNQVFADTQAPSVPTGLVATAVSSSQINLSWNASTDNVAVKGYHVYLNDVSIATTTATTFTHTGLTPNTTYNYRVSAYDAVPNHSAWTATPVAVTTMPAPPPLAYLPVIPGQAGYGMQTSAGRGGVVYKVTHLNASGAGSLRACTDASGPRVCVFEVSGNIDLGGGTLNIYNPFLTIAGQTAPAPGISIINGSFGIVTHDVLVQHIRTRAGLAPSRRTPFAIADDQGNAYNVVIDHISTAWSTDDLVLTWWGVHDITWSHVLATGELNNPGVYYDAQGKVMITDSADYNILMKDSALITGYARFPLAQANPFVFVNNIVYNWGGNATQFQRQRVQPHQQNVAGGEFVFDNNHYRTGPLHSQAWVQKPFFIRDYLVPDIHIYLNGNYAPDFVASRQWDLMENQSEYSQAQMQVSAPGAWPTGLVAKSAANGGIFESVLNNVGAFPLSRDSLDARLVSDARNRTGGYLTSTTFPTLAQHTRALTIPANPNGDDDSDGYTNLEEWLHCMAAQVEGRTCSAQTPAPPAPSPPPPSTTLAITSFQPTSDGTNGHYKILYTGTPTGAHVYFDTDRNAGTGYPVSGIGANYMVELGSGYGNLYSYSGSGTGGGWGWTSVKAVTYTNTGGVANITVARVDLGSPGSVDVVGSIQDAGTTLYATRVNQVFGSPTPTPPPPSPSPSVQFFCTFPNSPTNCGFYEQAKVPGRASIVNTVARDGSTAVRLHTEPGDNNVAGSGAHERNDLSLSQVASDGYEGHEAWWAHSILFPSDYVNPPMSTATTWNWGALFGWHHTGSTGQGNGSLHAYPDTAISPDRRTGLFFVGHGGPTQDGGEFIAPIGPVVRNVWYDFVYHVKWSSGSDGVFDVWLRVGNETIARQVLSHRGPTLYTGMGSYLKLGNYHTAFGQPSSVIYDRIIRGTAWQAVSLTPLEGVDDSPFLPQP